MNFSRASLAFTLLFSTVLSACGTQTLTVATQSPLQSASVQAAARQSTQTQKSPVKTTQVTVNNLSQEKQALALQPVSAETVKAQLELRAQKATPKADENTPLYSATELDALKKLEASLADQIKEEDQKNASTQGFKTKSADHGKDIEIEMFLYNPKYSKSAKFWGIDNANELLMAGRSPLRRWLLKRKFEGLWAPRGFEQQILFWVEQADLLRITGVSRDQAWLLVANGITSVPDLARRNVIELGALKVSLALMAFQYGMDAPSLDELKDWTEEAKSLEPLIY
ncbi:hypothetical protein COW36_12190 [bacterium (Candidatus Blackallbacteria) CG17_big_fil_post_rev_8_21_14_2_50_48_46]|uniref:DUF4332 domain-containing protein n=1 Tax=bacterium (Candidatus Blackallbacteria) CG17_big_fil_post_rev_8_21_14_2_50_48_46 TaxID=2014261 RepID=A0A2M7G3S9_9BACT|nr:MAG: hypothetical protein COW64_03070 [bacterium (Candidatus Blackallbacteria) CG18_big_fil_WC_8_21_14_2_50_49_26]PIW16519.1 MAG: hypothetical protein COW36_12190 [bacterium (Candidatus Blackallbacteria) CG17_big_fil_post_rev_8_21_14_2_50_48_46]PIW46027.1 MAG: hypothetical protein COW20_17455 [bacterium (Candidatus Blackallbacteria) CG13_big_fil_rev_8_21_14_2_50_49_14]